MLTGPDFRVGLEACFTLHQCRACGLVSLRPQPAADQLLAHYPDWLWEDGLAAGTDLARKFKAVIAILRQWHPKPGRLLDVGCGPGDFVLAVEQLQWQARGIEVSRRQVEVGARRGAAVTVCEEFTQFASQIQYDVITFNHVLEHVPSPRAYLAHALELLKPGGLVLISVPNYDSLSRRLFGAYWTHADVPRHLFHFTPASLTGLLASVGFRVAQVCSRDREQDSLGARESLRRWVFHGVLRRSVRAGGRRPAAAMSAGRSWRVRAPRYMYRALGDAFAMATELLRIADTFTVVATRPVTHI